MATNAAPDPLQPTPSSAHSVIVPADPLRPRKLSEEFALILKEFEVETVTLREVLALLHGRGYVLLVMLLALPFCQPIPLPGLSTPLGFIIALISARLAVARKPWLPARLLDTRLPPKLFTRVFALTQKMVAWLERFLRPRTLWLTSTPALEQLHAIPIVICALLLLIPAPIPFSNVIPAWGILLLAGGILERDGRSIIAGYLATIVSVAYFALFSGAIALAAKQSWEFLMDWWHR